MHHFEQMHQYKAAEMAVKLNVPFSVKVALMWLRIKVTTILLHI